MSDGTPLFFAQLLSLPIGVVRPHRLNIGACFLRRFNHLSTRSFASRAIRTGIVPPSLRWAGPLNQRICWNPYPLSTPIRRMRVEHGRSHVGMKRTEVGHAEFPRTAVTSRIRNTKMSPNTQLQYIHTQTCHCSFSDYLQSLSFRSSNIARASFRMVRSFAFSASGA